MALRQAAPRFYDVRIATGRRYMAAMMFYTQLQALNDRTHAALRLQSVTRYHYAAGANSVPALAGEAFECARQYPLVFAGAVGAAVPAILLGLREGENLFVDNEGRWLGRYVPAFIRRYPFALGTGESGDPVVCIDGAASCLSATQGEPLFADGAPSATLQKTMAFLREFQAAALATQTLVAKIEALGLLREADSLAQFNDGSQFRLSGIRVIADGQTQ
jgi:hypothetical protein